MEAREKPHCEFGAKCYRKNPKHLESYSHPHKKGDSFEENVIVGSMKTVLEANHKNSACGFNIMNEEQTTVTFSKTSGVSLVAKPQIATSIRKNFFLQTDKKESHSSSHERKIVFDERKPKAISFKRKRRERIVSEGPYIKKVKTGSLLNTSSSNDVLAESTNGSSNCESVHSTSLIFTEINSSETKSSSGVIDLKNKTAKQIIKTLFLVDMPPDFYSFYEFCEFVRSSFHLEMVKFGELKLVGPFDILSGKVNYSLDPDSYLCHWRFYYDPPEFQTVLAAESGYHIGYWRDEPKENPVFLASNNPNKDCIFKIEAENLFGAVFHYLNEFKRIGDPFKKVETARLQLALKNWAEKNKFTLERKTNKISSRKKRIVSKTFHCAGIVVPVEAKTELGYRPLIETDVRLKNICNLIMKANDENERECLWENLQPLITAANIANDECDFGNSLELGIDLFCMGSSVFHETIEHLLTTAYSLLNRTEFGKIIRAHLKFRRKDIFSYAIKLS